MKPSRVLPIAALAVSSIVMLFVKRLPLQDYPLHVLVAQVLAHPEGYARYYEPDLKLRPYIGSYGLAVAFGRWLSADAATRLGLLIYALGTPLAVWAYTRETAPARAPAAVLAIPAIWSGLYYLGFVNFLMAVPFAYGALAAMLAFTRRPCVAAAAGYAVLSAACYLCHATAFATLVLASLGIALLAPRAARGGALVLAGVVAVAALVLTPRDVLGGIRFSYVPHGAGMPVPAATRPFQLLSPITSLLYIPAYVACDATLGDGALWGIALGALLLSRRAHRRDPEPAARRERFVLPVLALLLLLALPGATPYIDYVNAKMTAFLFFSLPPLVPARLLDRRTLASLSLFACLSQFYAASTHLRFAREAAGFEAVLASVPRDSKVLTLVLAPKSDVLLWTAPYVHFGFLVQAERGGLGCEVFEGPQIPVRMKPEGRTGMIALEGQPWLAGSHPLPAHDLLLVIAPPAVRRPEGYAPVTERARFRLYRSML